MIEPVVPNVGKTALPAVRGVLDMEASQHLAPGLAPGPSSSHQQGQGGAVGGQQYICLGANTNTIYHEHEHWQYLLTVTDPSIIFPSKSSPKLLLAVETTTTDSF